MSTLTRSGDRLERDGVTIGGHSGVCKQKDVSAATVAFKDLDLRRRAVVGTNLPDRGWEGDRAATILPSESFASRAAGFSPREQTSVGPGFSPRDATTGKMMNGHSGVRRYALSDLTGRSVGSVGDSEHR